MAGTQPKTGLRGHVSPASSTCGCVPPLLRPPLSEDTPSQSGSPRRRPQGDRHLWGHSALGSAVSESQSLRSCQGASRGKPGAPGSGVCDLRDDPRGPALHAPPGASGPVLYRWGAHVACPCPCLTLRLCSVPPHPHYRTRTGLSRRAHAGLRRLRSLARTRWGSESVWEPLRAASGSGAVGTGPEQTSVLICCRA